jgi:hypothetical protein
MRPASTERQVVEDEVHLLPQQRGALATQFLVEAVGAVHLRDFVVATEEEHVRGPQNLIGEEQHDDLQRVLPAIDVVPEEEDLLLRRHTHDREPSEYW